MSAMIGAYSSHSAVFSSVLDPLDRLDRAAPFTRVRIAGDRVRRRHPAAIAIQNCGLLAFHIFNLLLYIV